MTARGACAAPVSRIDQLRPAVGGPERAAVGVDREPDVLSRNDASVTAVVVGTPTVNQLWPPSRVRAIVPSGPTMCAISALVARMRPNDEPMNRSPTGDHVIPASSDVTVAPRSPTPIARVADAKPTA